MIVRPSRVPAHPACWNRSPELFLVYFLLINPPTATSKSFAEAKLDFTDSMSLLTRARLAVAMPMTDCG